MAKTRRVEIPRLVRHPKYGKILRRKTVCHVHDEAERVAPRRHGRDSSSRGRAPRPKRWELVRVVSKSRLVDIAAMRAADREESEVATELRPGLAVASRRQPIQRAKSISRPQRPDQSGVKP